MKIYKLVAKLNMWKTRDLPLFGRTMLVKALGLSKQMMFTGKQITIENKSIFRRHLLQQNVVTDRSILRECDICNFIKLIREQFFD